MTAKGTVCAPSKSISISSRNVKPTVLAVAKASHLKSQHNRFVEGAVCGSPSVLLSAVNPANDRLSEENLKLKNEIKNLRDTLEANYITLENHQEENEDLKTELEELEEDFDALVDELDEEIALSKKINLVLAQRTKRLKLLQDENHHLQQCLVAKNAAEAKLREKNKRLKVDVDAQQLMICKIQKLQDEKNHLQQCFIAKTAAEVKLREESERLKSDAVELQLMIRKIEIKHKESLKEQLSLQDQVDGLRDVVEEAIVDLKKKDDIVKDFEIKIFDSSFCMSELSSDLDIALEKNRQMDDVNKLNLQAIQRNYEVRINYMQEEFEKELKSVNEENEEVQRRLTDRIAGLRDVVEEAIVDLKKKDNIVKDFEIKEVDRSFFVSELSSELDIALKKNLQMEFLNKLNLQTIQPNHEDRFEKMLKRVSEENEEAQRRLTDQAFVT